MKQHAARTTAPAMSSGLAPGIRAAEAALAAGTARRLLIAEGTRNPRVLALARTATARGIPVAATTEKELARRTGAARHQGVAAEVAATATTTAAADWGAFWRERDSVEASGRSAGASAGRSARSAVLLVGLDGVTDPRNLGAVLRTARAFGADGVFAPRSRCAPLTAAARKAAAGAAEVLPYFLVPNLARALDELRARRVFVVGADAAASEDIFAAAQRAGPAGGWCWLLGGEGEGLRRLTREKCDALARIPTIAGDGGCLNVAVACGACLTARPGRAGLSGLAGRAGRG